MPQPQILLFGLTIDGVYAPIKVGGDGKINGSGEPASPITNPQLPQYLAYGKTGTGLIKPLALFADRKVR